MNKKLMSIIALVLACIMLFAACGNDSKTPVSTPQNDPPPASSSGNDEVKEPEVETGDDNGEWPDASNDPVVTLNFGGTNAVTDYCTIAMQRVADLAYERSGGTIVINVFPASQLGDVSAMHEAVSIGAQDMYMENCQSGWGNHGVPDSSATTLHWFLSGDELRTVMESELAEEWSQLYLETTNVYTICANWYRQPCCILSKVPVRSYEDFAGLKCRSTGAIANACLTEIGANPTTVAYSEVYLSLQQNVVDAAYATVDALYTMGWYEVTDYLIMTNQLYNSQACMINYDKWNSLTDAQKVILEGACIEAGDWYVEQTSAEAANYIKEMEASGVEIIEFTQEDRAKFEEASINVAYELEASGRFSEGLIDRILEIVGR